jgi:hypothetical protein
VQYNSKKGGGATIEGLAMSLQAATNGMDANNDILFLILTSHGTRAGLAVKAGRLTQTLTPSNLAYLLARTGMRYKVVVISACYSGVFIPRLANPDTLVITAADSDHPSFGCRDKAKWTYFGNAFFNIALRHAKSLKDAFVVARSLVKKREARERFDPSNPLMAGGENVHPLLVARATGRRCADPASAFSQSGAARRDRSKGHYQNTRRTEGRGGRSGLRCQNLSTAVKTAANRCVAGQVTRARSRIALQLRALLLRHAAGAASDKFITSPRAG